MSYTSCHNHTDYSNSSCGFTDSIIPYNKLIQTAYDLGLNGVSITEHECVSSSVKALKYYNSMKLDRPFKVILGNEIYLISEQEDMVLRGLEQGEEVPYYHFLLNALNNKGHKQIRELSSRAWKRGYTRNSLYRRPTYYSDLEEVIGNDKGNIIASTACLGSCVDKYIINNNYEKAKSAILYFNSLFGNGNFFLEIQPCSKKNENQLKVNKAMWDFSVSLNIPIICTTDSHYLKREHALAHKVLLNAKDGGDARETEEFYETTYLMDGNELREYLRISFTDEQIDTIFANTNSICDRVEGYSFEHAPIIPMIPLDKLQNFRKTDRYSQYYDKYEDFGYYANISLENCPYNALNDEIRTLVKQDEYFFYRIEKSLYELIEGNGKDVETYIDRLNKEFHELKIISNSFNSSMASYYTCMSQIINLIWDSDSFSMPSRGSGMGYVICYLLEITQIDPVPLGEYAPHWRHLSAERGVEIADIDNDSQNSRREQIISSMVDYFGSDRVLNVLTVSTLSAKTAIEKACKGLFKIGLISITDGEIGYLKSLIPSERGAIWSLKDCFDDNEEKGRTKVTELINEVAKFPKLKECAFLFEGLIVNRGIHASGVLVGNHDFIEEISCMRSPNGVLCSCYDLHDAEYCGWTKVDILTIQASDKIRKTMDLLLEYGKIDWQGSLKDTYWKYLHPDVLDYDTFEMWEMIKSIYSIFQFDTPVAVKSLNQVEPHSVMDLSATNSLLRLMAQDGKESPLDKYTRYKKDINEWYKDMTEYGLSKIEQEILIEHLSNSYGLADSQEKVMLLSMDNRIAGFTLKEANNLRKAIAKKRADVLEQTNKLFFECCKRQGCSEKLANYIWEEEFAMSFGYSFSQLHSYAYSVIALQELNLNYYYPRVYWNTACLTVESQSDEDGKGNTDYGKIAKAIYKMRKFGVEVLPPDINKANISFTPNEENNTILFGLGGISGINIEIAKQIIANRPYENFDDFYKKNKYEGSLITKSKFITLIKAGCFDSTDDKIVAMKWLCVYENPKKDSLTTSNIPNAISIGVTLPAELIKAYNFIKYVKQFFYCNDPNFKSKKHYLIEEEYALPYFEEFCMDKLEEEKDYYYTPNGLVVVDKSLEKSLQPQMDKLKELLKSREVVEQYNTLLLKKAYLDMVGIEDANKWSFEAVSFYPNGNHELESINMEEYNLTTYGSLPEEPMFIEKSFGKRSWKQYDISRICGTVLDRKDKDNFITILTNDNEVVNVRFNKGQYAYYKQTIEDGESKDESYFKRGTLLMISGYRRGEDVFVAKKYKNTVYQHTCIKISKMEQDGTAELQLTRLGAEEG